MNAQIINKAGIEQDSGSKVDSDSDGSADCASSIAIGSLSASVQIKNAAAKNGLPRSEMFSSFNLARWRGV